MRRGQANGRFINNSYECAYKKLKNRLSAKKDKKKKRKKAKQSEENAKKKQDKKKKRERNKPLRKLIDFLTCHTAEVHSPYEVGCPPLTPSPSSGQFRFALKANEAGTKCKNKGNFYGNLHE